MKNLGFRATDLFPTTQNRYYMEALNWSQAFSDAALKMTPTVPDMQFLGLIGQGLKFLGCLVILVFASTVFLIQAILTFIKYVHVSYVGYKNRKHERSIELKEHEEKVAEEKRKREKFEALKIATEEERINQSKKLIKLKNEGDFELMNELIEKWVNEYRVDDWTDRFLTMKK